MDEATNIWSKHLQPGESLVWQVEASRHLRRAEVARRRWVAVLIGLACAVLSGAFGWKLYEAITGAAPSDLGAGIGIPLYAALALTFAAVFLAQLGRLNPKLTSAVRYAATSNRLISVNASGGIVDQVDVQDVAGLILGGRRSAPDLFVLRKHDDTNVRAFAIEHIEEPFEAKATIEEQILEHPHE